jgi:hypothetical protein
MSKPVPVFRPIGAPLDEVSDDVLNQLSDKLGVPSLKKPEQPPSPSRSGQPSPPRAAVARIPEQVDEAADVPLEKLSVLVPDYLTLALRERSAKERLSQRYYVMKGLQAIGFPVEPADLISDGRRLRSKAGKS